MPEGVGLVWKLRPHGQVQLEGTFKRTNFAKMLLARLVVVEGLLAGRSLLAESKN